MFGHIRETQERIMRLLALPLLLVLTAQLATANEDVDPYKAIEGTWSVVKLEIGGKVQDKADLSGEFRFGPEITKMVSAGETVEFKHELRPSKKPTEKPPELNFYANTMTSKLILRGIYRHDGDELVICVAPETQPRPGEFKTTKEGGEIMFTMKRKK
jgi:uncharacterized protein (TIGR03067 family)